jgi:hypothetical protein
MTGTALWLAGAMLAQGVLTFIVTGLLYQARIPLIMRREVRIGEIALDKGKWPDRSRLVANAFENQFEMPVLFFVAALLAMQFEASLIEVGLAWLFVVSRYVHAFIHLTSNHVVPRFFVYAAGVVILGVFWLELIVRFILVAVRGA